VPCLRGMVSQFALASRRQTPNVLPSLLDLTPRAFRPFSRPAFSRLFQPIALGFDCWLLEGLGQCADGHGVASKNWPPRLPRGDRLHTQGPRRRTSPAAQTGLPDAVALSRSRKLVALSQRLEKPLAAAQKGSQAALPAGAR